jgi:hypothetical protein
MTIINILKHKRIYFYRSEAVNSFENLNPRDIARGEVRLSLHMMKNSHDAEFIKDSLYSIENKGWLSHFNIIELQILQLNIEKTLSLWQDFTVIRDKKHTIEVIQIIIDILLNQTDKQFVENLVNAKNASTNINISLNNTSLNQFLK